MMRTLLTLLLATICIVGYSQKKPKISQAMAAMKKGELAEAKSIIDAAIDYEKTKEDPKTWFYRGQIYATLDTLNGEPGAMEEAIAAFDKTLELDPEQKKVSTFTTAGIENVDSKRQGYYAYYYNNAIENYNLKSYEAATSDFEAAFFINPSDTNAILNAAYSAVAGGDEAKAKSAFQRSIDAGVRDKTAFLQLYNYAVQEERFEDGLAIIRKAKEVHPNETDFAKYEINLLIQSNQTEQAKTELISAIEADPSNADLHFSLGVLNEELGDKENALVSYDKALEVDPMHFNSNFNKGVMVFNEANELIKERNALSYKETARNKELTTQINSKLESALPLWETLYSLNSSDVTVLETLTYIYNSLKMNDKYNKTQAELDALTGN